MSSNPIYIYLGNVGPQGVVGAQGPQGPQGATGTSVVLASNTAFVDPNGNDSTALIGNANKPFLTILAAITAASFGDTIFMRPGTYTSPGVVTKNGLTFQGSGRPSYNSQTTPTALQGGTILLGTFNMTGSYVRAYDFGVDCGSAWCTAFNGGNGADCFLWGGGSSYDCDAARITTLGQSASSQFHSTKMEGFIGRGRFQDFETFYNIYGVVIKGTDGQSLNHNGNYHNNGGVIKADAGQVTTNAKIMNMVANNTTIGVTVWNNGGTLADFTIDGLYCPNGNGVNFGDTNAANITGFNRITSLTCYNCNFGVDLIPDNGTAPIDFLLIEKLYANGGTAGGTAGIRNGASTAVMLVRDSKIVGFGSWSILNYGPLLIYEGVNYMSGGQIYAPGTSSYNNGSIIGGAAVNGLIQALSGLDTNGNAGTNIVGAGLKIKEGTNARMGTATLSGGTITVSNTSITSTTRVFLTTEGGTVTNVGHPYVSARTAGTGFTITSTNALDASTVGYLLVEPS